MELVEVDPAGPGASGALAELVRVVNAVREAESPWEHPMTVREAAGDLRWGWDLDPTTGLLAVAGGEVVGAAEYAVSRYDNAHLAWLDVRVHPDRRRRDHGSRMFEALAARAVADGRTTVQLEAWDTPAARGFARRHALEQRSVAVMRRQDLGRLDARGLEALGDEARPHASAYELVWLSGPVPEDALGAYAVMVASINDAPVDDLDVEDEMFSPDRVRAYEEAQRLRGQRLHRVFARHRTTGELAGQTSVAVDGERPWLAEQHDTSVVSGHRGHRLGVLLKIEMLALLADREPQVTVLDTWNAESNHHMVAVNQALGYRVLGRELTLQRRVR